MSAFPHLTREILRIDAAAETGRIVAAIREFVSRKWNRKGAVVALSGGLDSSVVACLCARALGRNNVLALLMPESESAPDTLRLGRKVAAFLKIQTVVEDITPILRAARYYSRREQLVRDAIPGCRGGSRFRLILPSVEPSQTAALYSMVIQRPGGEFFWAPLTPQSYQEIVAANNVKHRTRKMMAYYYADQLDYAVVGTVNRLKYDQGLFVKHGDGAADLEPIAHLVRSQVCQLAAHLSVPAEVRRRPPSAEVYPLQPPQGKPYLLLPVEDMDLCIYAEGCGIAAAHVACALDLDTCQVEQIYQAIRLKRSAAEYLRATPVLISQAQSWPEC